MTQGALKSQLLKLNVSDRGENKYPVREKQGFFLAVCHVAISGVPEGWNKPIKNV